jgi:hypothetical protein
MEPSAMV